MNNFQIPRTQSKSKHKRKNFSKQIIHATTIVKIKLVLTLEKKDETSKLKKKIYISSCV